MDTIILGIDPGTRVTGYGVIRHRGDRLTHVGHGVIAPEEKLELPERLAWIGDGIRELLQRHQPHFVVLEKIFLGRNVDSAFKLGHARGVLMGEAARAGSMVVEYAARQVKKGICGNGGASKEEAQMVVERLLGIRGIQRLDASDALALACFHAFEHRKRTLLGRGVEA